MSGLSEWCFDTTYITAWNSFLLELMTIAVALHFILFFLLFRSCHIYYKSDLCKWYLDILLGAIFFKLSKVFRKKKNFFNSLD